MFYILGPLDSEELKAQKEAALQATQNPDDPVAEAAQTTDKQELSPEEQAVINIENQTVHFGKMEADPIALSKLHQDIRDLTNKMTASEKLSEAQNNRDRQGYQSTFE